jgi:Condensation domain
MDRIPASFCQGLLHASAGESGYDNFNLLVALRINGPFSSVWVERALAGLIDRHEALRTTLHYAKGDLEQDIWPTIACQVVNIDLQSSPQDLQARLLGFADADMQLRDSTLVAACVFEMTPREHVVAIKLSHAISDGWSCAIVMSEFCELYLFHAAGKPTTLEPLSAQFRHYVEMERAAGEPARQAYWKRQRLTMPSAGSPIRTPTLTRRLTLYRAIPLIAPSVASALRATAYEERASPASAIAAAVTTSLLSWYQESITIGLVHANRYERALDGVVGPIAEVLPVVVDLSGNPTYREMIARVQRAWLAALANHLSQLQISRCTGFDFLEGESTICDLEINYIPSTNWRVATSARMGDHDLTRIESVSVPLAGRRLLWGRYAMCAPWGIMLTEDESGHQRGTIYAQDDKGAADTLARLADGFVNTLADAVTQPDRPLRTLLAHRAAV